MLGGRSSIPGPQHQGLQQVSRQIQIPAASFDFFQRRRVARAPLILRTRWHPDGLVSLLSQQIQQPLQGSTWQPLAFDFRPHSRLELYYPQELREPMAAVRGTSIWQHHIRQRRFLLVTYDPEGVLALLNRPEPTTTAVQSFHIWRPPPVIFGPRLRQEWVITHITPPPRRTRLDRWRDHLRSFPGLALCNHILAPQANRPGGPST